MLAGPSVPAAPGRFSITIDWPRCFSVAVASARIAMSVEPPGGHGTISVTGRVGNCCACAMVERIKMAAASSSLMSPSLTAPSLVMVAASSRMPNRGPDRNGGHCGVLAVEDRARCLLVGRAGQEGREGRCLDWRAKFCRAQEPAGDEE